MKEWHDLNEIGLANMIFWLNGRGGGDAIKESNLKRAPFSPASAHEAASLIPPATLCIREMSIYRRDGGCHRRRSEKADPSLMDVRRRHGEADAALSARQHARRAANEIQTRIHIHVFLKNRKWNLKRHM